MISLVSLGIDCGNVNQKANFSDSLSFCYASGKVVKYEMLHMQTGIDNPK